MAPHHFLQPKPFSPPPRNRIAAAMRRLPVYLLLDCSESMVGEAIDSVDYGVKTLVDALRSDPHALETAWLSIITFSHHAQQVVPLKELIDVQVPKLFPGPGTSLGKALTMLRDCIQREVRNTTPDQKGDYRPLVFLLTDGHPTDDWQEIKQSVDRMTSPRIANFYAIGCGEDIDFDMLNDVADVVFKMSDMSPASLKKLFIWLTASVQNASSGINASDDYQGIDISKKPSELTEVPRGSHQRYTGPPLQVFLKAYCINEALPYLMRFRLNHEYGLYEPINAHKLPNESEGGGVFDTPSINASQLMGPAPCPHCPNSTAGLCGCGALMCLPEDPPPIVICPRCNQQIGMSDSGGDFTLQQSAG
ncbi:MAG: VWA domain-containing protein [Planctomycetota bacterium]